MIIDNIAPVLLVSFVILKAWEVRGRSAGRYISFKGPRETIEKYGTMRGTRGNTVPCDLGDSRSRVMQSGWIHAWKWSARVLTYSSRSSRDLHAHTGRPPV